MNYAGSREGLSYVWGAEDAQRSKAGQPPIHESDRYEAFWYDLGKSHQNGGFRLIPWDLVTAIAVQPEQRAWYLDGFAGGLEIRKGNKPSPVSGPNTKDFNDWVTAGRYDGQDGIYTARYVITTEPRIAIDYGPKKGSDAIVVPPPPMSSPPVYAGAPIYEVAAYFLNKLVPLDRLLQVARFTEATLKRPGLRMLFDAAVEFRVLGDTPGEEREGYRLSGPVGLAAKYLAVLQAQSKSPVPLNPATFGLPAWFATRTSGGGRRGGVRFLSKSELRDLGIDPNDYA